MALSCASTKVNLATYWIMGFMQFDAVEIALQDGRKPASSLRLTLIAHVTAARCLNSLALPLAARQHFAERFGGVPAVVEADVGGGEAEAQDVGVAEIADHLAGDQRLAQFVGVFVAERELAAAPLPGRPG